MNDTIPQDIPQKQCTKCKQWFPATTDFFWKHSRGGLYPRCIPCKKAEAQIYNENHVEHRKQWYQKNRETILEKQRQYRKEHQEEINEQQRQDYQKKHELHLIWGRVAGQKRRMRKKGVKGELTAQQIKAKLKAQKYTCYYCLNTLKRCKDGTYIYQLDHTIPLSRPEFTPRHDVNYVVITCVQCNNSKKSRLPHEWSQGGRLF